MSKENRYKKMSSDRGLMLKTSDGESITVKISKKGVVSLKSNLNPDHGGLGTFEITGLTAKKAATKKKSFWGKLWGKIKGAVGAVLDAVTVPVFGHSCRPDITIDLDGRGVTFGISCKEI